MAPPPKSLSAWLVSSLTFLPSTPNLRHQTPRPLTTPGRARPGVVNGLGVWWRKFGVDGKNVNELTSQALSDFGGGATFYDCLVEVEAA